MFARALQIDPTHRPSLLAQVEGGEAKPESVIDAKTALLATASAEEKVRLLNDIGDLYLEKLEAPPKAIESYREALELKPEDQRTLHKCLDVYVEQKQWAQALEMLERLIGVEKVPQVRAKYRHAAGLICRDELGRPEQAAKLLSEALDDDPAADRSAEALETLLRDRQEWKDLARFYRRALKRLGGETSDGKNGERLRVWSALGELCLDKLGERESAIAALEVALTLDRGNLKRHEQLAELYLASGPDYAEKAIGEHQVLLRADKGRVASYRALKQLYSSNGQRDKAAAAAYALSFLKKGDADDHRQAAEQKNRAFAWSRRGLTEEQWGRVAHPDEDRALDALFAAVAPMLSLANAQTHKQANLNRKDAIDQNDARPIARALRHAASALGAALPRGLRAPRAERAGRVPRHQRQERAPAGAAARPAAPRREAPRARARVRAGSQARAPAPRAAPALSILPGSGAAPAHHRSRHGARRRGRRHRRRAEDGAGHEACALAGRARAGRVGGPQGQGGQRAPRGAGAELAASDRPQREPRWPPAHRRSSRSPRVWSRAPSAASATTLPPMQRLLDLVWSSVTEDLFLLRKQLGA